MSTRTRDRKCPSCGFTNFIRDTQSSAGDLVCGNCGVVQEENPIVSEVQFGESSSGAAIVQGSMVGPNQTRAYSQGSALESKEHTLMRAKYKMKIIAQVMKIPEYIVNSAFGWFQLALNRNFVKGRRSQNVLAACLYVACRKVKTHHLLIDFSSRLQISVYSLGATFLKLVRLLEIKQLEPVDTSLFIQHFAEKLGFGDQTAKVCKDATALARRMSADWICHGRRPAGIAGACLLLAARMNNFQRSHAELVAVAHVAEETIQRRLNEFKKTSSAQISIQGFRTAAADSQYFKSTDAKPPAIVRNKEIEKKLQRVLRQRTRTLERYRQLAKDGKLLNSLEVSSDTLTAAEIAESKEELVKAIETANLALKESQRKSKRQNKNLESDDKIKSHQEAGDDDAMEEDDDAMEEDADEDEDEEHNNRSDAEEADPSSILNEVDAITPGALAQSGLDFLEDVKPRLTRSRVKRQISKYKIEDTNETNSSSDEETNDLFVPDLEGEDDYGYDDLPEAPSKQEDDDADYIEPKPKSKPSVGRLSSLRSSGRLEGLGNIKSGPSRGRSRLDTLSPSPSSLTGKSRNLRGVDDEDDEEPEREARLDELLKAILDGGSLKEEDLEKALDAILQKNKSTTGTDGNYDYSNDEEKERIILKHWPRNLVKNSPTSDEILKKIRDDEELDELDDDDEVEDVKLSEEEIKEKEKMWIAINHDFLIAQEKKRLKMVADELAGNSSGQMKRRRTVVPRKTNTNDTSRQNTVKDRMMSPAESTRQMLQKKSYSKKINYQIFPELFLEQNEAQN